MPAKVVDASVMGAILFGEPEAESALALLADTDLVAPTLLAYELTNIARTKIIRHPDQKEAVARALKDGLALDINWIEVEHTAVLQLALAVGLTTYDASYLRVARSLGLPLVTFDRRLQAAYSSPS